MIVKEICIKKSKLSTLLDKVDEFKSEMSEFMFNRPNYSYNVDIDEANDEWLANITINNDEENTTAPGDVGTHGVL